MYPPLYTFYRNISDAVEVLRISHVIFYDKTSIGGLASGYFIENSYLLGLTPQELGLAWKVKDCQHAQDSCKTHLSTPKVYATQQINIFTTTRYIRALYKLRIRPS